MTDIPHNIVALLGEVPLINSVLDKPRLQQLAGVLLCFAPVREAVHAVVQPVNHLGG